MDFSAIANEVSNKYAPVIMDDINKKFHEDIELFSQNFNHYFQQICILIDKLILNIETYETQVKALSGIDSVVVSIQKLKLKKDLIYKDFFELQNLMNLLVYQKVVMTYVHVDPVNGKREIRLFDNNIDHLGVNYINQYGKSYAKLGYEVSEHYQQLKNSLSAAENDGLQNTAREVEERYARHKGRILWKINNEIFGYKLNNRGPINEAFVAFYLRNVQLNNSLMENINAFMVSSDPQGVIYADNANGFLIGDVQLGGLQFAVKGAYGSPQNFTMIVNWLKQIKEQNYSMTAFQNFIQRFKEAEQEKATSLVKPMVQKSIDSMVRYHGESLFRSYLPIV